MFVGDGIAACRGFHDWKLPISVDSGTRFFSQTIWIRSAAEGFLFHCISDFITITIAERQIGEIITPVVRGTQRQLIIRAVCFLHNSRNSGFVTIV